MQLKINTSSRRGQPLVANDRKMFGANVLDEVREYMAPLHYSVTPLHRMDALAESLGVESLWMKDEGVRSNLCSFKALGGAYAVIRLVLSEASKAFRVPVPVGGLLSPAVRAVARQLTVTCATAGNHGRSIASGARLTGCGAVIFVHDGVSDGRIAAIRELGAEARRVNGSYDDSVAAASQAAIDYGWHVVSDTSWPGYEEIPARVMQGYLLMVEEALEQCRGDGASFTHVFLQAGVGGFAAAVAAHLTLRFGPTAPRFVVVEPTRAGCLFQSAIAERAIRIEPSEPTIMAMLECYEPSMIAWRILERLAHAFTMIDESSALAAMRRLASPLPGDPFISSGESGGAGLAGLIEASRDEQSRQLLGLDQESVVLVFNTEGATDPTLYASLLAEAG